METTTDPFLLFLLQYVKCNIPGPDTPRKKFREQIQGCECADKACEDECACVTRYGVSYKSGRLVGVDPFINKQKPIFECNKSCDCGNKCGNRLVQFAVQIPLMVFRTERKGFGLMALEGIAVNQFVCEYAGEVLTHATARERTVDQGAKESGNNYIFVLNEHMLSSGETMSTYVDPTYIGNVGRFINHSCDPNLFMVPVRINRTIPHLALFALRAIAAGEELSFDYSGTISTPPGGATTRGPIMNGDAAMPGTSSSANGGAADVDLRLKECHCGAASCRGFLPYDASLYGDGAGSGSELTGSETLKSTSTAGLTSL